MTVTQTAVHPDNGLSSHEKVWGSRKRSLESERAAHCVTPPTRHSGRGGRSGVGWGARGRQVTGDSRGVILGRWMRVLIQRSKPTECATLRMSLWVSLGPWVIMCQRRFVFGEKRTILVNDVDNGGGCIRGAGGGREYRNSLCLFFSVLL